MIYGTPNRSLYFYQKDIIGCWSSVKLTEMVDLPAGRLQPEVHEIYSDWRFGT